MRHVILSLWLTCSSIILFGQTASISGVVKNAEDQPLSGAVIVLDGTAYGALTEEDGSYRIEGFDVGSYTIIVSYAGMKSLRQTLMLEGDLEFSPRLQRDSGFALPGEATDEDKVKLLTIPEASVYGIGSVPKDGVFANTALTREDIQPLDNGQDMPYLLRFTPSVVTTSDAGAGIGYTGMRIRGTDQRGINVTLNGIPYNDPESHGVFWVNLPDFAGSADNISIQRGVGSSTNGAGAFGGTIGISTLDFDDDPYAEISNSVGSFNTFRHRVAFGTGRMDNGFAIEGRLSQITSDGYVDRASSDLRSYYMAGSYETERTQIKAVVFGGKEVTYQSWWGVPEVALNGTETEIRDWAAINGYNERRTDDLVNLGRRANYYTYDNQVDNYAQDHYQLHLNHDFGEGLTLQVSGHYTYGRGYFEEFRERDRLSNYGLDNIVFNGVQQFSDAFDANGNPIPINNEFESNYNWDHVEFTHTVVNDAAGDPITDNDGNLLLNSIAGISRSDLIRRRWLENDFYGTTYSLTWDKNLGNNSVSIIAGGAWNTYDGDHFGEIIWMQHPNDVQHEDLYYFNNGLKTDFNNYVKVNYLINNKISIYADMQMRDVNYTIRGIDRNRNPADIDDNFRFFNPKGGISAQLTEKDQIYSSFAVANREPIRRDYIDAPDGAFPRHETLRNLEFGYRRNGKNYAVGVNFYNMDYTDQLVLTGEINDVGAPIRTNVESSYRRGVEIEATYEPVKRLTLSANATFSQNIIRNFSEDVPVYDDFFSLIGFERTEFEETEIAFAPNRVAAAILAYRFVDAKKHKAEVAWQTKFVDSQFLDNTANTDRMMPSYLVNDLRLTYALLDTGMRSLEVNLLLNNILDEKFVNNGYTYAFIFGGERVDENFYYPQAGRNFLLSLTLNF